MVFGTTYCAISHLPINDGDKCFLIPLGFEMDFDFNQFDKADINCFMYLYKFIDKPQQVVYNGSPDEIFYVDKNSSGYELYMLIHFDFFNAIQLQFKNESLENVSKLPLFKTVNKIWRKANEFEEGERKKIQSQLQANAISKDEFLKQVTDIKTPDWILKIYKLALFIDGLGIIPYPNHTVDQHERNLLYEKIRSECVNSAG